MDNITYPPTYRYLNQEDQLLAGDEYLAADENAEWTPADLGAARPAQALYRRKLTAEETVERHYRKLQSMGFSADTHLADALDRIELRLNNSRKAVEDAPKLRQENEQAARTIQALSLELSMLRNAHRTATGRQGQEGVHVCVSTNTYETPDKLAPLRFQLNVQCMLWPEALPNALDALSRDVAREVVRAVQKEHPSWGTPQLDRIKTHRESVRDSVLDRGTFRQLWDHRDAAVANNPSAFERTKLTAKPTSLNGDAIKQ